MGVESDFFVDITRVPRQFFCPICKEVVCDPVVTCYGHLFCKDELLSWLARTARCPVTRKPLVTDQLRKPESLVMGIYADLEVRCLNKDGGCEWTGPIGDLGRHIDKSHKNSVYAKNKALLNKPCTFCQQHHPLSAPSRPAEDAAVARNLNIGALTFIASFTVGLALDLTRPFLPFGLSHSIVLRVIETTAKILAMVLLLWGLVYTAINLPHT
ncbi:hypothetical protein EON65_56830 [archaeon]|nr:MAG: hypothetical protein EON65_56830 [archaeon]